MIGKKIEIKAEKIKILEGGYIAIACGANATTIVLYSINTERGGRSRRLNIYLTGNP